MNSVLLLAQTLTNLLTAPVGSGLPAGWNLSRTKGAEPPAFNVTRSHTLQVIAVGQAGTATYRLRSPIPPPPSLQAGSLTWRWRAGTPLRAADLKRRNTDAYTWGNRESRGESFASWAGRNRMVVVLQRAEDADGSWHVEKRDPFSDYRRLWNNAPKAIVSVGVGADTDGLKVRGAAEIGDMTWHAP